MPRSTTAPLRHGVPDAHYKVSAFGFPFPLDCSFFLDRGQRETLTRAALFGRPKHWASSSLATHFPAPGKT